MQFVPILSVMAQMCSERTLPGPQTKRHPEKGGKLNTSQAGSVAASRAAVGQFLSISREAFILMTRYGISFTDTVPAVISPTTACLLTVLERGELKMVVSSEDACV